MTQLSDLKANRRVFIRRLLVVCLGLILHCGHLTHPARAQKAPNIDGVYRLLSEATTFTTPKTTKSLRKPPEWTGLFFFQAGYFSVTLMDQSREADWFTKFPSSVRKLGFESFAGNYEIVGDKLILRRELKLHPFYDGRLRKFEVKIDGNNLTLVENIRPYTEDLTEGKRVLTLQRVQ